MNNADSGFFSRRGSSEFSTNLYKLGNLEFVDVLLNLMQHFLMRIISGQSELVFATRVHQSGRQSQQVDTNRLQCCGLPTANQTQTFEPVDQVVRQEDQMKVSLIDQEVVGGNLSQREIVFQLPDVQFGASPLFVKGPHATWTQRKVADDRVVMMVLEFPQGELLLLIFSFGTTNDVKMMFLLPMAWLIYKLCGLPLTFFAKGAVTKMLDFFFDGFGHIRHNRISYSHIVEGFDELVIVKSAIGSDTDAIHVRGNLLQTRLPQRLDVCCRARISWSQHAVPTVSGVTFEAHQRMVTWPAFLLWIVAYLGLLDLPTIQRKDGRVQVEDQTGRTLPREIPNPLAQDVVNVDQPTQFRRRQAFEKFPQGRSLWEALQPKECLQVSIVRQNSRLGNSFHPSDHAVENAHEQLRWMIITAASLPGNVPLQLSLQIQFSTKLLKKNHSTIVRQTWILEGEFDFLQSFAHLTESSLLVRFVSDINNTYDYRWLSSIILAFLTHNSRYSRFFQVQKELEE